MYIQFSCYNLLIDNKIDGHLCNVAREKKGDELHDLIQGNNWQLTEADTAGELCVWFFEVFVRFFLMQSLSLI